MESLHRCFHPKHTTYPANGSGRDNYIGYDDGGLMPRSLPLQRVSHTQLTFAKTQKVLAPAPRFEPGTLRYAADGTGRDYYVTVDSGGLLSAYTPGGRKDQFLASLRSDGRRRYLADTDFFGWANRAWHAPSSRAKQHRKRIIVSQLTNRLYVQTSLPSFRRSVSNTETAVVG